MTTNKPINEQALTMIRELLAGDGRQWGEYSPQELYSVGWAAELLLAEVERLRAREQALAAENAAMRPIVEAMAREMAVYWNSDLHRFCCHRCDAPPTLNMNRIAHEPDCCYMQARAFIAAHPAPDTAAEESEDE